MTDGHDRLDRELYGAAIGLEKADWYLVRFERFAAGGGRIGWNWPAFFVSFFWLLYRKMWVWAVAYFLVPIPLFMVLGMVSVVTSYKVYLVATLLYWLAIFIVFPMFANALYYRHVRRKVALARHSCTSRERAITWLAGSGGTSEAAAAVAAVIFAFWLVFVGGILAAISIPAYQDYVMRARLLQAWQQTAPAREALAWEINHSSVLPESLAELEVEPEIRFGETSGLLSYDPADGSLEVEFTTGKLAGKRLAITPYLDAEARILWRCRSEDIEQDWLPRQCRETDSP